MPPRDLRRLFESEPLLAERCVRFSADRGCDQADLKAWLWSRHGIRPIIDAHEMWRNECEGLRAEPGGPMLRPLRGDWTDNVLHAGKGEASCRYPETGTVRPMAFQGLEADRDALKRRCPAAAYGLECAGRALYSQRAGVAAEGFGRTLRIPLKQVDPRIFTPTLRGPPDLAARLRSAHRPGAHQRSH